MTRKKVNGVIYVVILLCVFLSVQNANAQKTTVSAKVDPSEIKIGQQAVLDVQAIAPVGERVAFPVFQGKLVEGIEVLAMLKADTTTAHGVMTINQKYIITSFDSTLYNITYIPVIAGKDTLKTNGFGLKVKSVELSSSTKEYLTQIKGKSEPLDFIKLKLHDIKDVLSAPFVWTDFLIYFLWALLIVLLLALIVAAFILYKRKKEKGYYFRPKVVLPPHILAMQALDEIKSKKIWQQGLEKEYFTELTDILREYIENRYGVSSFEKTSDEILHSLKLVTDTESPLDGLKQILKLADLVKFAKYKPLPDENDLSLMNAYLYINQTKIEEVTTPENSEANEEETEEQGTKK
jgi:hypothetical protein